MSHHYIAEHRSIFVKPCKDNLELREGVLILDFAEKYLLCKMLPNHSTEITNKRLSTHLLCTIKTLYQLPYIFLLLVLLTICKIYFIKKSMLFLIYVSDR